jgi:two-component system, cell cycle response regulator DivK
MLSHNVIDGWSPAAPAFDGSDTSRRSGIPGPTNPRTGGRSHLILVVDDEPANLALAQALLESEGFEVRTAKDAISAFEVLKDCDPSLILMDIQLPGMDGWELTNRLKRNMATGHIPVIALTAYGREGDEERAREIGFVEFVAKPVSTRELPSIVRRHLPRG